MQGDFNSDCVSRRDRKSEILKRRSERVDRRVTQIVSIRIESECGRKIKDTRRELGDALKSAAVDADIDTDKVDGSRRIPKVFVLCRVCAAAWSGEFDAHLVIDLSCDIDGISRQRLHGRDGNASARAG